MFVFRTYPTHVSCVIYDIMPYVSCLNIRSMFHVCSTFQTRSMFCLDVLYLTHMHHYDVILPSIDCSLSLSHLDRSGVP
jgi:hypothetical protein